MKASKYYNQLFNTLDCSKEDADKFNEARWNEVDKRFKDRESLVFEIERLFRETGTVIHKETFRKRILGLLK